MNYKKEKEQFQEVIELIELFVDDNFEVVGLCSNCSENGEAYPEPYDYKGSYKREAKKLFESIKKLIG